jgi:hypothetical protein
MTSGIASTVENKAAIYVQLQKGTTFKEATTTQNNICHFSQISTLPRNLLPPSSGQKTLPTDLQSVTSQEIVIEHSHTFTILFL